jgi:hypothetical protein
MIGWLVHDVIQGFLVQMHIDKQLPKLVEPEDVINGEYILGVDLGNPKIIFQSFAKSVHFFLL